MWVVDSATNKVAAIVDLGNDSSRRPLLPPSGGAAGPLVRQGVGGAALRGGGRPSVDPVVFFKLQLIMFFEDLRSERQLMRVVADRLSLRSDTWATTSTSLCPITPR